MTKILLPALLTLNGLADIILAILPPSLPFSLHAFLRDRGGLQTLTSTSDGLLIIDLLCVMFINFGLTRLSVAFALNYLDVRTAKVMGIMSYTMEICVFGYLLLSKNATNQVAPMIVLPFMLIGLLVVIPYSNANTKKKIQ